MEIRPASLDQVVAGRNGQLVEIADDVQGIASALNAIDRHIRLRYSERGGYFVVYWLPDEWEEGDGYRIFTAQELDHRVVKKMEQVYAKCNAPGYSFGEELDRADAESKKQTEYEWDQQMGEAAEQMAHAMRHDLSYDKRRIFVPEGISG